MAHNNHDINYLSVGFCESENVKIAHKEEIAIPMDEISISFEEYHTERTAK